MSNYIKINSADNVAVALHDIAKGDKIDVNGFSVIAAEDIPQGHKAALCGIKAGENIVKYGFPIGHASQDICEGAWVHVHNTKTNLSETAQYTYAPNITELEKTDDAVFNGFVRDDGRAAVRNEIWIIPTVGCVNGVAQKIAQQNSFLVGGSLEGIYTFPHPFGCSQMGGDHAQTRKLLAALARHPNAAGVLVLSLGCENLTHEQFAAELGEYDENRVKFLTCQDVEDEFEAASALLSQLADYAKKFTRRPVSVSQLVIGMKCGGSDGLSGITGNPTVGAFSDMLISKGGSTVLTEVPEMFGAEGLLMNRCKNKAVFDKAVKMITDFKHYYTSHNQVVYENPSPGNKKGGITTLEDKSCGCVQKGGSAPVSDVIGYGDAVVTKGLNLLSGPGNDLVSATALTAAGAHMILFTTGRGTPFGAPVPTLKISTNTRLFEKKSNWIDFNAGTAADGESIQDAGRRLFDKVVSVAGGEQTKTEINGFREISIFKDGVVL